MKHFVGILSSCLCMPGRHTLSITVTTTTQYSVFRVILTHSVSFTMLNSCDPKYDLPNHPLMCIQVAIPVLCSRHSNAILLPHPCASGPPRLHFLRATPPCNPWHEKLPQRLAHVTEHRKVQDDSATCNDGGHQPGVGRWGRRGQGVA